MVAKMLSDCKGSCGKPRQTSTRGKTLIFTSLYNIATSLLFGLPMPIQPMKSIAAVAVSESPHLTTFRIAAAGLCTAATLFLLGLNGLMSFFYRFIPLPIIRGVQLSQGLSFAFTAIKYARFNQDFATSKSTSARSWLGLDGLLLALAAILFLVLTSGFGDYGTHNQEFDIDNTDDVNNSRRRLGLHNRLRILSAIPAALIVFLLGFILCFIRDPIIFNDLRFGPSEISVLQITWDDWKLGFLRAAIASLFVKFEYLKEMQD